MADVVNMIITICGKTNTALISSTMTLQSIQNSEVCSTETYSELHQLTNVFHG
jgi:hypothetical protein